MGLAVLPGSFVTGWGRNAATLYENDVEMNDVIANMPMFWIDVAP